MNTRSKNTVLLLTLRTFSLTGGIEKVCRTMARALSEICGDRGILLYSMYDDDEDLDQRYIRPENFRGFSQIKGAFLWSAVLQGIRAQKVILSHVNLLPVAWLIKKLAPRTEIILMAHGIEVWRELKPWKTKFVRKDCGVWAVSNYTAGILHEKHNIPKVQIQVLNNGLDPYFSVPAIRERPDSLVYRHGILQSDPILFTLTRISSTEGYKGYDLVLEVLPEIIKVHPTLLYFIAGKADPAEQQRLEEMIRALHLENNVVLLGYIPDEKISKYYQLSDIFIMPSRKEGFGLVFIEAAACGTKVIAGNQDGSADALLNGRLGTLVDPTDRTAIRDAILRNLSKTELHDRKAIQKACLSNFSYRAYREKLRKLVTVTTDLPHAAQGKTPQYEIIPAR